MMESAATYQAVQAVAPGRLELVRKPIRDPGPGEVRIRVEACSVCHSDTATVDGVFPIDWPRVPGHEAVGRIDALGDHVQGWVVGRASSKLGWRPRKDSPTHIGRARK